MFSLSTSSHWLKGHQHYLLTIYRNSKGKMCDILVSIKQPYQFSYNHVSYMSLLQHPLVQLLNRVETLHTLHERMVYVGLISCIWHLTIILEPLSISIPISIDIYMCVFFFNCNEYVFLGKWIKFKGEHISVHTSHQFAWYVC